MSNDTLIKLHQQLDRAIRLYPEDTLAMMDVVADSAPERRVKGRSFEEVMPELLAALTRYYDKFPRETLEFVCMWLAKYDMGLVHPHAVLNMLQNADADERKSLASRLRMADPAAQALVQVLMRQYMPEIHAEVFAPVAQAEEAVATVSEVSQDA